ncbi:hypothetical protein BHYA_0346g00050 [Botrytis hyacinthi]|uniref:Heterokaryon incompatibility domain-containing protein n=1 Tax=Botrytis hyacinthi TaxID=278943 RepID=A0A4Z1GAQ5_9HELO|nr:hypothetical protein BHYA_0346g00050 [Botrytis hyacinthi]
MNGQDYEIAKDIPSSSSSWNSGSKVQNDSTDRIETDEGFKTLSPKTEDIERYGSNSARLYQDHSFDHVLDGSPWSNSRPSSKLCAVCQNMVDGLGRGHWLERSKEIKYKFYDTAIPHVRNPRSLRISAQSGCSFCAILIRDDDDEEKKRDAQISRYIDEWKASFGEGPFPFSQGYIESQSRDNDKWSLNLRFPIDPHWKDRVCGFEFVVEIRQSLQKYYITLQLEPPKSKPNNEVFEDLDTVSNTRQSIPLIKEWLSACQRLHPRCKSQRPDFVPTRLIDLQAGRPKLCLGSLIEENDLQSATLSHCWGAPRKKYQTLTKSTLLNFLSRIETDELPKTFHDAIKIWIDSLCIVQDDNEDWTRESFTMANVYGSCLLNIAASSSIDGSQGCSFDRSDAPRCHISLKVDGKINASYYCTKIRTHALDDLNFCQLESQGWVLQERLLSPRTVHFTREQVFWDCDTKFVSESSPFDFNTAENSRGTGSWLKEPLSIRNWNRIVANYTGRCLTYEADRLIALAGIAEKIQRQTKDKYFSGMWYDNLLEQLCWYVRDPMVDQKFSARRAPTWSWASLASQLVILGGLPNFDDVKSKILQVEKLGSVCRFGDMPNVALWLSCAPLLTIQNIESKTKILDKLSIDYSNIHFDCLEDTSSLDMDSNMCNVYILRLFSKEGLILRRFKETQGEYERIGHILLSGYGDLDLDDEVNHAEESAHVPREKHNFDTDEHVMVLV